MAKTPTTTASAGAAAGAANADAAAKEQIEANALAAELEASNRKMQNIPEPEPEPAEPRPDPVPGLPMKYTLTDDEKSAREKHVKPFLVLGDGVSLRGKARQRNEEVMLTPSEARGHQERGIPLQDVEAEKKRQKDRDGKPRLVGGDGGPADSPTPPAAA